MEYEKHGGGERGGKGGRERERERERKRRRRYSIMIHILHGSQGRFAVRTDIVQ